MLLFVFYILYIHIFFPHSTSLTYLLLNPSPPPHAPLSQAGNYSGVGTPLDPHDALNGGFGDGNGMYARLLEMRDTQKRYSAALYCDSSIDGISKSSRYRKAKGREKEERGGLDSEGGINVYICICICLLSVITRTTCVFFN